MIQVTKPFLPPEEEYQQIVSGIWSRNWLTNNGPLVNDLETRLRETFGVNHLIAVGNGTIALQIAIKALDLKGEIITTPFTYVATVSSIVWESCKPRFVDIDPDTFNLDPDKIEAQITPETTAIMGTHVFGNPCDISKIEEIAKKHNLRVIYDASHCYGSLYKGKSVLAYGDINTISFHATKVFHTIEGGAITTNDREISKRMSYMRNFGHDGPEKFNGVGINGKLSEFHAGMGLVNLNYIDDILTKRKKDCHLYDSRLDDPRLKKQQITNGAQTNYSYYPVVFESEDQLLKVMELLNKYEIFPRRYFYPSLHTLDYVESSSLPASEDISKRILCLPLYYDLSEVEIDLICRYVMTAIDEPA
ncbi:MAG: DegT/DnrJ/EryC1/StrS family aminotransferase [Cyclobacteriaceae bacterium]